MLLLFILVNCWPSPLGDGTTDVNIEYETDVNKSSIDDVVIIIPFPVYISSAASANSQIRVYSRS
jgi:hypothetical protein